MVDKNKCTGCTACYAVCAKNAIRMQRDEDGFLQPQVDASRCVNCNLCEMVCPVHKDYTSEVKRVVACRSRKEEIVACSSSGGVFSVLAERVLLHGGAVFGCALTDAKYARHVCIESEGELDQLRRSKYVQSDKNDTFEMVQNMQSSLWKKKLSEKSFRLAISCMWMVTSAGTTQHSWSRKKMAPE